MSVPNFYDILGVPFEASEEAIRKAWKIAVRRNHPDKVPQDNVEQVKISSEKVSLINEAYATLTNDLARKRYDLIVGVRSGRCSICGKAGKLRLGLNGEAVAICDICYNWDNSFKF